MDTRILSHGQITDLSRGFNLGGIPFSVYVRAKNASMESDTLIKCKLICDKEPGNLPVPISDWTPAMIVSITPDAISLDNYDVFWGAGETINN